MKTMTHYVGILAVVFSFGLVLAKSANAEQAPSSEELRAEYPNLEEGSTRPENKRILCPFVRMLERAGLFDSNRTDNNKIIVSIIDLGTAAHKLACATGTCSLVATLVSAGQVATAKWSEKLKMIGNVDITALNKAEGVAHECGFTFEKGANTISETQIARTLARLKSRSNSEGHVSFNAIMATKLEICAEQGVTITKAGETEAKLIYAYLGGVDRGYVELSDISRLFHAEMPLTKAEQYIDPTYMNQVK